MINVLACISFILGKMAYLNGYYQSIERILVLRVQKSNTRFYKDITWYIIVHTAG